jgi:hypothetical protein
MRKRRITCRRGWPVPESATQWLRSWPFSPGDARSSAKGARVSSREQLPIVEKPFVWSGGSRGLSGLFVHKWLRRSLDQRVEACRDLDQIAFLSLGHPFALGTHELGSY